MRGGGSVCGTAGWSIPDTFVGLPILRADIRMWRPDPVLSDRGNPVHIFASSPKTR
jgi:hypothetical protein